MSFNFKSDAVKPNVMNIDTENVNFEGIEAGQTSFTGSEVKVNEVKTGEMNAGNITAGTTTVSHVSTSKLEMGPMTGSSSISSSGMFISDSEINFGTVETVNQISSSNINGATGITFGYTRDQLIEIDNLHLAPSSVMVDSDGKNWYAQEDGSIEDWFGRRPLKLWSNVYFPSFDFRNLDIFAGHDQEVNLTATSFSNKNFIGTRDAEKGMVIKAGPASVTGLGWHWHRVLRFENIGGRTRERKKLEFVLRQKASGDMAAIGGNSNAWLWYMVGAMAVRVGYKQVSKGGGLHDTYADSRYAPTYSTYMSGIPLVYKTSNYNYTHAYFNQNGYHGAAHPPVLSGDPDKWVKFTIESHSDKFSCRLVCVNPTPANPYGDEYGNVASWSMSAKNNWQQYALGFSVYKINEEDELHLLAARVV